MTARNLGEKKIRSQVIAVTFGVECVFVQTLTMGMIYFIFFVNKSRNTTAKEADILSLRSTLSFLSDFI